MDGLVSVAKYSVSSKSLVHCADKGSFIFVSVSRQMMDRHLRISNHCLSYSCLRQIFLSIIILHMRHILRYMTPDEKLLYSPSQHGWWMVDTVSKICNCRRPVSERSVSGYFIIHSREERNRTKCGSSPQAQECAANWEMDPEAIHPRSKGVRGSGLNTEALLSCVGRQVIRKGLREGKRCGF